MNTDRIIERAAYNNARWCEAVCAAHRIAGEFAAGIWVNRNPVPRFYPNAVTLSAGYKPEQLRRIEELVGAAKAGGFAVAVKDSFAALDLAALGFKVLFDAQWIYRPASTPKPELHLDGVRWMRIEDAGGLVRWETAWSGDSANAGRIFLPPLLEDRDIAIVGAVRGEQVVAGVIANRSDDVVGMSNLFGPAADSSKFAAACLAAIVDAFPGRDIVGYESGPALKAAQAAGFAAVGALRIWSNAE